MKEICALHEAKLKAHLAELRDHPFKMAIHSIFPFETGNKNSQSPADKVIGMIHLLNKTVFPVLFGMSFGKEKGSLPKNLLKLARPIMIALSLKVLRKIFSKNKRKETEA
ncbi:MAG TPA: hypothetical protein VE978_05920 [Chitinophagales bacterium]|nr:hypothetical protein [Chitinophagales bacterium]